MNLSHQSKLHLKKIGRSRWLCTNPSKGPLAFCTGDTWMDAYLNYVSMVELMAQI